VKAAFESLEVHADGNEAVLTAKVPYAFFKKVLSERRLNSALKTQKPPEQNPPAAKKNLPKQSKSTKLPVPLRPVERTWYAETYGDSLACHECGLHSADAARCYGR